MVGGTRQIQCRNMQVNAKVECDAGTPCQLAGGCDELKRGTAIRRKGEVTCRGTEGARRNAGDREEA